MHSCVKISALTSLITSYETELTRDFAAAVRRPSRIQSINYDENPHHPIQAEEHATKLSRLRDVTSLAEVHPICACSCWDEAVVWRSVCVCVCSHLLPALLVLATGYCRVVGCRKVSICHRRLRRDGTTGVEDAFTK